MLEKFDVIRVLLMAPKSWASTGREGGWQGGAVAELFYFVKKRIRAKLYFCSFVFFPRFPIIYN